MADGTVNIAVVGYGYWGPNLVRNVIERPELSLWGLCELNPARAADFTRRYPGNRTCDSFEQLLADPSLDAVAIATPPSTHYALGKQALEAGKHVLVEKPLATNPAEAEALAELAERQGLVLMPGHTFLYSPAVNKVRDLIESGDLGEVYFVTSSRMNLGMYQPDGVINDLAPHDLSILLYWLDQPVSMVAASGSTVFQNGVPETAFLTLCFERGPTANVQLSWLAPRKVRQMIVVEADAWSSTTTLPPMAPSGSTTAASTSPSRRTSASTSSRTGQGTWSCRGWNPPSRSASSSLTSPRRYRTAPLHVRMRAWAWRSSESSRVPTNR